jgi:hypothetical protein
MMDGMALLVVSVYDQSESIKTRRTRLDEAEQRCSNAAMHNRIPALARDTWASSSLLYMYILSTDDMI